MPAGIGSCRERFSADGSFDDWLFVQRQTVDSCYTALARNGSATPPAANVTPFGLYNDRPDVVSSGDHEIQLESTTR
jgi:hypothetical protein